MTPLPMSLPVLFATLVAAAAAAGTGDEASPLPTLPKEYTAVIQMRMPYIPLEMPLRVLTSAAAQKIEYYDGLQVDVHSPNGTYKYSFNNTVRVCSYAPPASGPMLREALGAEAWSAMPFFPDLAKYSYERDELVGGRFLQKFVLSVRHGSSGSMDDHLSFYWDAVLGKPVRWHMHSRHVTFGSHTDEYIMDFLSFEAGPPAEAELSLPPKCVQRPSQAPAGGVSVQVHGLLAAAHSAAARASEGQDDLFGAYLDQQGKAYAGEEREHRQAVFERNVRLVNELNQQHAGRAAFGGNRFLDMTAAEVLRFRGGKNRGSSRTTRRTPELWRFVRVHELPLAASAGKEERPENFDWRSARPGVVSPVKDQAMCGSCWTYGVTEPIESIQAIRTGGKLVELQEQFVVDCTWTNNTGASGSNSGCDGGDSDIGALVIVDKFSGRIPSAEAYGSYLSVNGFCKVPRWGPLETGATIKGWVDIKKRDEQALLHALFTVGPLNVNIQVPEEMLFYESGVLNVEACRHNESQIDHAVVATGYGTDAHGTAYYTIRNSWSTYWGDQGYLKIARGEFDCCVACEAGYPDVEVPASTSLLV